MTPPKNIQNRVVGLDGMEAETTCVNRAQVEELQGIGHEVRAGEGKQPRINVVVVAESALLQAGNVAGSGQIVRRIDGTGVERESCRSAWDGWR